MSNAERHLCHDLDRSPHAPSITVRGVGVDLDFVPVLRDVEFEVPSGRITVLMGASGVGKTVLIKQIVGLLAPDAGTILIGDVDVWSSSATALSRVRRNLSVLHGGATIYDGSIHGSLSIRDQLLAHLYEKNVNTDERSRRRARANPYLKLWNEGVARPPDLPELAARAQTWLDRFGLTDVADLAAHEASPGLRRRAALAAALAVDVPLYLLDDFDGALDGVYRSVVIGAVTDIQRRTSSTMLVASHDRALAETIADHLVVLAGGRVAYEGVPAAGFAGLTEYYRGSCVEAGSGLPAEEPARVAVSDRRAAHEHIVPESTGNRRRAANVVTVAVLLLGVVLVVVAGVHLLAGLGVFGSE